MFMQNINVVRIYEMSIKLRFFCIILRNTWYRGYPRGFLSIGTKKTHCDCSSHQKLAKLFLNQYLWSYQSYSPHFGFYTHIFDPTELKNNIFKQLNLSGVSKFGLVGSKRVSKSPNWPNGSNIDISKPIRATVLILGSVINLYCHFLPHWAQK